ncbi:hypothetical protein GCM10025793_19370 [Lysobacter lycopersici]
MTKGQWEATAWIVLAVSIATNAAQYLKHRSDREAVREQAFEACADILHKRTLDDGYRARTPAARQPSAPLGQNERCIGGQRFRKDGNAWTQVAGRCD